MGHRTSRALVTSAALAACTVALGVSTGAHGAPPGEEGGTCSPAPRQRPVCSTGPGGVATAAFLDPSATVVRPGAVHLGEHVYVGPFARLLARGAGPEGVVLGAESNVQDNVTVEARPRSDRARTEALRRVGLRPGDGVRTGERVILAHGSSVRGPALLGAGPVRQVPDGAGGTAEDSGVFVSFGAMVDGAVLERDSGLSALARVGPGVRLRSGYIVLPGKDVRTQAEADDPALGKVRPITQADREFNAGVVEVNVGLAREYSRLAQDDADAVRGIGPDPGGNEFDRSRDLPSVESSLCTGPEVSDPGFRNRIIGDVCFEDTADHLDDALGERISLRADEGGPFGVGHVERMDDRVVFHALEGSDLHVGNRVSYGSGVVVHGGGRPQVDPTTGVAAPTVIGNDVVLHDGAVVFRSLVANGSVVGTRSAVVGSELRAGQRIPDRTVYVNDAVFGPVEW